MFLEYAVNDSGELVYVEQVARGKTDLHCPYCGGLLLARKGEIKAHHFAHAGETCRQVERDQDTIALPCYDNFNLHLPPKVLRDLLAFHAGESGYDVARLERYELIQWNEWALNRRGEYELTKKGKIPVGKLSLHLFNEYQEPLILSKHGELEAVAAEAYAKPRYEARLAEIEAEARPMLDASGHLPLRREDGPRLAKLNDELWAVRGKLKAIPTDYQTALTDLRLYRAQLRRVLSCSLYFLSIDDGHLYKIGVTTRPIDERIAEIQADLTPHLSKVKVDVIDTWPHRGNVELYFKHRYKAHNQPIGVLSEYFKFDDAKAVIRDLRRMKAKDLSDSERIILAGLPSGLEMAIRDEQIEQRRREGIRAGLKKAVNRGQHIGRPKGSAESDAAFLAKHTAVRKALSQGLSLREAARAADVSVNTVRKVKCLLDED
jgi:hypothetical protein